MGSPFFMFHGLVAGGWDGVGLRLGVGGEEGFGVVEFVFWHFRMLQLCREFADNCLLLPLGS